MLRIIKKSKNFHFFVKNHKISRIFFKNFSNKENLKDTKENIGEQNEELKKKMKSVLFFNETNKPEGRQVKGQTISEKTEQTEQTDKAEQSNESQNDQKTESQDKTTDSTTQGEQTAESEPENPSFGKKLLNGFVNLWKQTFPAFEDDVETKMIKRMQEAKKIKTSFKELTEEEINEIELSIPEWKRGALILMEADDSATSSDKTYLDLIKDKIKVHIKNSDVYHKFKTSDKYKEYLQFKEDYKVAKQNLQEEIYSSQNPLLMDRVNIRSSTAEATEIMRKHDPNFSIFELEKEVTYIFGQTMKAYYRDDSDMVRLLTSGVAYAYLNSLITSRKERKQELKFKDLLFVDQPQFMTAMVTDEENVFFRFRISCQEMPSLIDKKTGKAVDATKEFEVESCQYIIDIEKASDPAIEEVGHDWVIVHLERIGVVKQIL